MSDGVGQSLKKVGSRFAFEYFLEIWKPRLIEMQRKWLAAVTVEDVKRMVKRGKFPDSAGLNFGAVRDYYEYLEKISTERLFEDYIAPARPDLAQAIQEMGMPGAQWLVKLRDHLMKQAKGPGVLSTEETQVSPMKEDIVQALCDVCDKSWPVPRDEFDKIESCPFCGHKQGEEAKPSEEG